jgi:hypothetical protein
MRFMLARTRTIPSRVAAWFVPVILFWLVLAVEIPYAYSRYFHQFYLVVFLVLLLLFYGLFRLKGDLSVFAVLGLIMILLALGLSYLWTSGYSDNFLIAGLLPYKDTKNYYLGATLLLNGWPIRVAGQALGRPLFPGFLSSLLLLSAGNLKVAVAVLAQLTGVGMFLSARQVRRGMGALAGTLFVTFMYFYFQLYVGYTMSEALGFIGGCFGFVLLWNAASKRSWFDLLLGFGLLMVAVSARAGAFFIFPLFALWAGWAFRGAKRFSMLVFAIALIIIVAGYLSVNTVYPRLLGIREGSSFGNFAYTLYGQVRGGMGWHSAIEELGTRNPSLVYQAAWDAFLATPSGFLGGVLRAYADFFLPGLGSIWTFGDSASDLVLWCFSIILMLRGLYLLGFRHRSAISALLLAGWVGVFLSIPFLPPVDGGNRFYASTMPFFFVLLAAGVGRVPPGEGPAPVQNEQIFLRFVSVSLLALTVLLPPLTLRASRRPAINLGDCPLEERPFAIRVNQGSYIDFVPDDTTSCGLAPEICFNDFRRHNTEMQIDDFYQELDALASSAQPRLRLIPTINLLDGNFQYFVATGSALLAASPNELLAGCAIRIQTENQRIFLVNSVKPLDE